jgi:ABC-2 type transport system permease protein
MTNTIGSNIEGRLLKTLIQELAWLFRHKGALIILLGAPILYALFYPLPYQHAVVGDIPLVVWDDEQSSTTRAWINSLDASPKLNVIATLRGEPNAQVFDQYGNAQLFIHFPKGLDKNLASQQQTVIAYGGKADNFLVYSEGVKSMSLVLAHINQSLALKAFYFTEGNAITASRAAQPIEVDVTQLFNTDSSYMQYLVPSVFILIVQQVLMMALGMHWGYRFEMNREVGHVFYVWLAHITIYSLQGLALIVFFFRIMLPLQGVPYTADGLKLLSVALPFVLSVVGFGMVVSVLFREQESAIIWLLPLSVPIMLMAGISWPNFAMASWVQVLAQCIPSTWGMNALIDVAFIGHLPNYKVGWAGAFIWLSLALCVRKIVVDREQVVDPSIV